MSRFADVLRRERTGKDLTNRDRFDHFPACDLLSPRLHLRPSRPDDSRQWRAIRTRNRERLRRYEPLWPKDALSPEYFLLRRRTQIRNWRNDRGYAFLIFMRDEGRLIGGVNINHVCRGAAQSATLGYWIDAAEEGRGYMSEAVRLIQAFAFEQIDLHRLEAACLPGNLRSRKMLERTGFTEEGFARHYIRINGVWEDHVLYGLPVEMWKSSS